MRCVVKGTGTWGSSAPPLVQQVQDVGAVDGTAADVLSGVQRDHARSHDGERDEDAADDDAKTYHRIGAIAGVLEEGHRQSEA